MNPSTAPATGRHVVPIRPASEADDDKETKRPRRSFGKVMKLRSGRYQASYAAGGKRHLAPVTFQTKGDAAAWLDMRHAELLEHRWKPPPPAEPDKVHFKDYGLQWLETRDLGPKTRAEYKRMFDGPRVSYFHPFTLDEITPVMIKAWFDIQDPAHPTARRRAYELVRAILATASKPDEDTDAPALLASSPARLTSKTLNRRPPGADAKPKTRIKPASLAELAAIMDAMPDRYAAMVLLAAWCAPRFSELTELRRPDLSIVRNAKGKPTSGVLHISRAVVWPEPDKAVVKENKTEAGLRDVSIPPHILAPLLDHVDKWAAPGPDGLLFPAVESPIKHMKHGALYKVYRRARKVAGRPDLRWHDLRHTGATLAAQTGATLAELMNRLGHSDVKAALIYQHAAADRDAEIARRLSAMAEEAVQTSGGYSPSTETTANSDKGP
ncbi:MAG: site-specific integrase [Micropruina sp.]|uniref:tyrosine-type recombinase/integrase n=1 Tax=Micropruina sp. TaxID=2737536 RepID=UPI0039E6B146